MSETNDNVKTRNVVVTRVFDAPVEQVWRAWTDSQQVMRWWGPAGFTSPVAKMDVREGGTSLVCMRAPSELGGQDIYNTWTYHEVIPNERLEFMLNFADKNGNKVDPAAVGMPPGIPTDVRHVIIFNDLGNNKTKITVTEYGYTSDDIVDISKAGLEQSLDKMAASFGPD
jgi:uncharacterized protein YndB with AHSA1/START domain